MRPISLLTANGSSGIDTARAFEPKVEVRSVIVTLAELALGSTLPDPDPYVNAPQQQLMRS